MDIRSVLNSVGRLFKHGVVWRVAIVLISASIACLMVEVVLRFFAPQYATYVRSNDIIGYSFIPRADYFFVAPEDCPGWSSSGTMNSLGLRDYEHSYAKEAHVFRILALGDSYTEGFQHQLNQNWPSLLEKRLNDRGGDVRFEVINMGLSGMGIAQEYLLYENEGYKYDADLVLVLFIPNDFADSSKLNKNGPFYVLQDSNLVLDSGFKDKSSYRWKKRLQPLKERSYLVTFLVKSYIQIKGHFSESTPRSFDSRTPSPDRYQDTDFSLQEIEAIEVSKRLFCMLNASVIQDGSRLAVAIGSTGAQVNQNRSAERMNLSKFLDNDLLMQEFLEREGLDHINLVPILREYSIENEAFIHGCPKNGGMGHWSKLGHEIVSDAINQFLIDQGLIP